MSDYALPNPSVTVNIRWINHWYGFIREDPATFKVSWRLMNAQLPDFIQEGVADDGVAAFVSLSAAHDAAIKEGATHHANDQEGNATNGTVQLAGPGDGEPADHPVPTSDTGDRERVERMDDGAEQNVVPA